MKTVFKKLILPIFLFAILICSTLYFTYGNKNSMERVKAGQTSVSVDDGGGSGTACRKVICARTRYLCSGPSSTKVYSGTCSCTGTIQGANVVINENVDNSTTSNCATICQSRVCTGCGGNYSGGSGTLTESSSCPSPGTSTNGQNCMYYVYNDESCNTSNGYVKIDGTATSESETFDSACPTGWNQAAVTVAGCTGIPQCADKTYSGSSQDIVPSYEHVSYSGNKSGIDAGTYNVSVSPHSTYRWCNGCGSAAQTLNCKINPKNINVSWNGTTPTASTGITGETISLGKEYQKEGTSTWTAGVPTAVGTYTLRATCTSVSGGQAKCSNYTLSGTKSYTVSSTPSYSSAEVPTNSLCKQNLVYTGAEQQIVSSTSGTGYTLSGYNQKDAGEYTITATLSSNYRWGGTESGTKEFKCKIDPKSVEVKWSNNVFPHDGQQHSQTPSATLVSGETINASTGWTREYKKSDGTSLGTTAPSDEGSYTVTVTCKAITGGQAKCSNYKFTKTTASFVIGNAMTLNPTSGTINVGDTFSFELTNPAGGTVTWTSSRPSVATVNNSGVVTGVSAGTTVITATTSTGSVNATIVVEAGITPSPDPEGTVQFEYDKYTCEVGKTITAVVRYANVPNPLSRPTITSSNTSVATVSLMTPRACTGSADTNCVALDNETIERCTAAGVTELTVERCISFYRSYYVNIACKATGTTTVTAAFSDTLKAQTTVTANEAGSNVTVIFDANGGSLTNNGEPSSSLQITLTGTGTIAEALSNITVAREGYTFDGWYTEDEGGVRYDDSVTFGAIGVEKLYAHWTESNGEKYTLTYDANGGTACSPATLEVPANTPWGELCKPSRKGYDFAGWFTSKTGGRKITESVLATGNMTVYAQWSKTAKDNANTGIVTPVIALLVVAIISTVTFLVVRKKRAQL